MNKSLLLVFFICIVVCPLLVFASGVGDSEKVTETSSDKSKGDTKETDGKKSNWFGRMSRNFANTIKEGGMPWFPEPLFVMGGETVESQGDSGTEVYARKEDNGKKDEEAEAKSNSRKKTGGLAFLFTVSHDPNDIQFLLYNDHLNPNKSEQLFLDDPESVKNSAFNPNYKTIFLIHGFWSNRSTGMPVTLRKSFLDARLPVNIIVPDWEKLGTPNPKKDTYSPLSYPIIVRKNIPIVYQRIGEFAQFLIDNKFTSLESLHIIGHSLGSHVSGGVGAVIANFTQNGGKKVSRISALDPAGPLFQGIKCQRKITHEDAEFVDIYHTASGTLGNSIYDDGHADFMPNGGHHQPGCVDHGQPTWEAQRGSCSHAFVFKIYAASVHRNMTACLCKPKFVEKGVDTACPGNCEETALAGYPLDPSARGQYYFKTGEDPFEESST